MSIYGNMAGGFGFPKTFILTDEKGTELTGIVVGQETVFTATADDIKIGKVAATDKGITEGVDTRTYRTTQGSIFIMQGDPFIIPLSDYDQYNYTKLYCMIALYNSSLNNSVAVDKIVFNDNVYAVNSTEVLSNVFKNSSNKSIDLNIINNTDSIYVIHYFTYKREE